MLDGQPVLLRLPQLNFDNDKAGKPVAINQHIGRRPIAAFGNSEGDQQMLEYTQGGSGARFGLLVLDDDAAREYAMEPNSVTAINILPESDATMLQRSEDNNARLLEVFPKGFALDAAHRPHITLLQRFVRTADLDRIHAAAGKVFAGTGVLGLRLEAFKYYRIPGGPVGLAGIVVRPTPELLELQQDLIDAVAPFALPTGRSDAFATTPEDPVIDPQLLEYVSTFVPHASGEQFDPHVTTGIAPRDYLDKMLAEPCEPFTFSPAGAAVYQLGQFGTAAKKLHEWGLKR